MNSSINVTCDTTDAGYQAVLHPNSIRSVETFMVEEINSNDSSVVFNASMNGPHSLTVFRKRNNGGIIINRKISSPVYRENIMVTGLPSTTTEPITDPPTTTNPTSPPTTTDPTVIQASGIIITLSLYTLSNIVATYKAILLVLAITYILYTYTASYCV